MNEIKNTGAMTAPNYIALHVHTEYSLLDGYATANELAERAKSLGMTAMAITDHGNMFGCIPFFDAMKKAGIKPIIGCEVYCAPGSRFEKGKGTDSSTEDGIKSKNEHLVLLCKNEQGYKNLCKLVTLASVEGKYIKPRIDMELLERYHEGLVCLSACIAGRIPKHIIAGDMDAARKDIRQFKGIFGEDFYLEVQNHGIPEEAVVSTAIYRLAKEFNVKVVATNDSHYARKEDAVAQDALLCIQTVALLSDTNRFKFPSDDYYVKSYDEMAALFPEHPEVLANTFEVADKCNFEYKFGEHMLPKFKAPEGYDDSEEGHFKFFSDLCHKGLEKRYGAEIPEEYNQRMDYELGIINSMGFIDYFLIVQDFINWAKDHGIPVGPGRGSGAGSICAYCSGITDVDPMKYGLLFERFLNPERVSLPDFDIDFCYSRRGEVIKYVTEKYGTEYVSQIVTYQTMAAKAAVKDVARIMGVPYQKSSLIAGKIPNEVHMSITKALEEAPDFKQLYDSDPEAHKVIELAQKLEGRPKSTSKHAAGLIINDRPVVDVVPLHLDDEGGMVGQATMVEMERLGPVKFDFLGLRTLTVINDAVKAVKAHYGIDIDINKLPEDDQAVFEDLGNAETLGVFQLESPGMRDVLKKLKPTCIEDLIAIIALYRPGPMSFIPDYIKNKHNPSGIVYDDERLEPILKNTYGILVYQEQVMSLFQVLGGFSLGESDMVRRAISKKKADVLEAKKKEFIYGTETACGALKNGVPLAVAEKIMNDVTDFAAYAFNKSHAACYAVIAYQTAWLKHYYPNEFYAAHASSFMDKSQKLREVLKKIQETGAHIAPPSINKSEVQFAAVDNKILVGLAGIKSVGSDIMGKVLEERRENGEFKSFFDFFSRMANKINLTKKTMEALIQSGTFDWTGYNRRTLLENWPSMWDSAKISSSGQATLFDYIDDGEKYMAPEMVVYQEYPEAVKLNFERNNMGIFISGHPIKWSEQIIKKTNADTPSELFAKLEKGESLDGKYVTIVGSMFDIKEKRTKKGDKMATFTLQDESGVLDSIMFSQALEASRDLVVESNNVAVKGYLEVSEERIQIKVSQIYGVPLDSQGEDIKKNFLQMVGKKKETKQVVSQNKMIQEHTPESAVCNAPSRGLHIKVKTRADIVPIAEIIQEAPGSQEVRFFIEDEDRNVMNKNLLVSVMNGKVMKKLVALVGDDNMKIK